MKFHQSAGDGGHKSILARRLPMLAGPRLESVKLRIVTGSLEEGDSLRNISLRHNKIEIRISAESEISIGQPGQHGSLERDRGYPLLLEHTIQTKHLAQEQHAVCSQVTRNLDQCFPVVGCKPVPFNPV